MLEAAQHAVEGALSRGPLLGQPVTDAKVDVLVSGNAVRCFLGLFFSFLD
jgi:hypothetical protein